MKIIHYPDPILNKKTAPVTLFDKQLFSEIKETLSAEQMVDPANTATERATRDLYEISLDDLMEYQESSMQGQIEKQKLPMALTANELSEIISKTKPKCLNNIFKILGIMKWFMIFIITLHTDNRFSVRLEIINKL